MGRGIVFGNVIGVEKISLSSKSYFAIAQRFSTSHEIVVSVF